jgi:hypothetical protein
LIIPRIALSILVKIIKVTEKAETTNSNLPLNLAKTIYKLC